MTPSDPVSRPSGRGPKAGSVTIVIVAFNHEAFVEQALSSAFAQTHADCSVLIFDDASSDGTAQRIHHYLDRTSMPATFVHHTTNQGVCSTLNEALERIDTEFMAFISADDFMETQRIEEQVGVLGGLGPEYGAVYSDIFLVDVTGRRLLGEATTYFGSRTPVAGDVFIELLKGFWIPAPSILYRRSVFETVGRYDEGLPFEDLDMCIRISRSFKFAYIPEPLVSYREVPNSLGKQIREHRSNDARARISMLRKHLGVSAEADRAIMKTMSYYTPVFYLEGARPRDVRRDLWVAAKQSRRPALLLYLGAAALSIPGAWISRVKTVVSRAPREPWSPPKVKRWSAWGSRVPRRPTVSR